MPSREILFGDVQYTEDGEKEVLIGDVEVNEDQAAAPAGGLPAGSLALTGVGV